MNNDLKTNPNVERIYGDINLKHRLIEIFGKKNTDYAFEAVKAVYNSIVQEYMARKDKKKFNTKFLHFYEYVLINKETFYTLVIVTPFGINNRIDFAKTPSVSKTLTATGDTNVKR